MPRYTLPSLSRLIFAVRAQRVEENRLTSTRSRGSDRAKSQPIAAAMTSVLPAKKMARFRNIRHPPLMRPKNVELLPSSMIAGSFDDKQRNAVRWQSCGWAHRGTGEGGGPAPTRSGGRKSDGPSPDTPLFSIGQRCSPSSRSEGPPYLAPRRGSLSLRCHPNCPPIGPRATIAAYGQHQQTI